MCSICKVRPQRAKNQSYCSECNREIGRKNYHDNKERYFKQAKKRDGELDLLIYRRKDVPCMDCGVRYPPYVMDFDHIGTDKEFNISTMRRRRMAFHKIVDEMNKCDVICSNCHRERTNSRVPSTRYKKIEEMDKAKNADI